MAKLIGSNGKGLSRIAAVTTGSFESGLSRGDRVVVNPSAWRTLGSLGRRVVLAHEMTHLATRAITVDDVPIWLSEGFADYVAYQAVEVPINVVAGDVLDDVRAGKGPRNLPEDADFDAAQGDIAAAANCSRNVIARRLSALSSTRRTRLTLGLGGDVLTSGDELSCPNPPLIGRLGPPVSTSAGREAGRSVRWVRDRVAARRAATRGETAGSSVGMDKRNVLPRPGSLLTEI